MTAATMVSSGMDQKTISAARIIQIAGGLLTIFGFAVSPLILANPEVLTDLISQ